MQVSDSFILTRTSDSCANNIKLNSLNNENFDGAASPSQARNNHDVVMERQISQTSQNLRHLPPLIADREMTPKNLSWNSIQVFSSQDHLSGEELRYFTTSPTLVFNFKTPNFSLASNAGAIPSPIIAGNTLLSPRGHRKSRAKNVANKILEKISQEKKLNLVFVTMWLEFTITQLPHAIFMMLSNLASEDDIGLATVLSLYFLDITYVLNPSLLCFTSPMFRDFVLCYYCS